MAIIGTLLKRGIRLRESLHQEYSSPFDLQKHELKELMITASQTEFGKFYGFDDILGKFRKSGNAFYEAYKATVPIHDYNKIYNEWWQLTQKGAKNVCWPGKVKYFALSSGTSESSSKHIPVTQDMIRSIKKVGFKQLYSMANYKIRPVAFEKGILMLGGTTSLFEKGEYYEGDMSGISAKNMPRWMSSLLYKPGQRISKRKKWEDRIKLIVEKATQWDVGIICGVP